MLSSINNGGLTHVRYGHACRPKLLEVVCPKCKSMAKAEKESERDYGTIIGDLSPSWNIDDWIISCTQCFHKESGISYDDLPKLFFSGGELNIWAWNKDHLTFLIKYLSGQSIKGDRYEWLSTYVPGRWKQQKDRTIKIMKKMHNKAN